MNTSAERTALSLTLPGFTGIIIRLISFLPIKWDIPHAVDSVLVALLIICFFIGPITSLICLVFVKIKSDMIRLKVAVACYICNGLWLIYIGYCITHLAPLGIQH